MDREAWTALKTQILRQSAKFLEERMKNRSTSQKKRKYRTLTLHLPRRLFEPRDTQDQPRKRIRLYLAASELAPLDGDEPKANAPMELC
jgi:hypothetical protein